jgi:hypothetical protein
MDYSEKYKKYKNKYLKLKAKLNDNQNGRGKLEKLVVPISNALLKPRPISLSQNLQPIQ